MVPAAGSRLSTRNGSASTRCTHKGSVGRIALPRDHRKYRTCLLQVNAEHAPRATTEPGRFCLVLDWSTRLGGPKTEKEAPLHQIRAGASKRRPHRRCGTTSANARRFAPSPTTSPARAAAQPRILPKTGSAQSEFARIRCSFAARAPAPTLWTSLERSDHSRAAERTDGGHI